MRLAVVFALLLPGCLFLLDDDDDCDFGGSADEAGLAEVEQRRDPFSGQCQEVIPPGGGGDQCDPLPEGDRAPEIPRGLCYSAGCEFLDELDCLDRVDCRAAYIDGLDALVYYDCWATPEPDVAIADPDGCGVLGAVECSLYNNCSAVHEPGCELGDACTDPEVGQFVQCVPEV